MEVIEAQTMNFKPNFKFSRLKFFLEGPPSQFGCALGNLGQSLTRLEIWGGSNSQWPKYSFPKNINLRWSIWATITLLFADQSSPIFWSNAEGVVVDGFFQTFHVTIRSEDNRNQSRKLSESRWILDVFSPKF